MAYAFRFHCFDEVDNPDLDKWDRRVKSIHVAVVADTEADAVTKVKALVTRKVCELDGVYELSELHPIDN